MKTHFEMFAAYNAWANSLIYQAASEMTPVDYTVKTGAFFGSMHATLNHILVADRVWMRRFTGHGMAPTSLDQILFDTLPYLHAARIAEDARITDYIASLDASACKTTFTYQPFGNFAPVTQHLGTALAHAFNHQTHHRGQAHMILTSLGYPSLALDLVYFLRQDAGKAWL